MQAASLAVELIQDIVELSTTVAGKGGGWGGLRHVRVGGHRAGGSQGGPSSGVGRGLPIWCRLSVMPSGALSLLQCSHAPCPPSSSPNRLPGAN
eukprot:scaffold7994_cov122-Isochrysis_galbana.AAC.9